MATYRLPASSFRVMMLRALQIYKSFKSHKLTSLIYLLDVLSPTLYEHNVLNVLINFFNLFIYTLFTFLSASLYVSKRGAY